MKRSSIDIPRCTELRYRSGWVEHTRLPPHEHARYTSTTQPFAFGVSFTGHRGAATRSGRDALHSRSFHPGTVGLNGPRTLEWLHVGEPSEGVEVHPGTEILDMVAVATRCQWDDLEAYRQSAFDEVIWGTCIAFRAAAHGRRTVTATEAEAMIVNLTMHVAVHHIGGIAPRAFAGRLPPRIVSRVGAYLQRHCDRVVPLTEMASVAAMSPYHFHRSFRRTVGVTPATFANALRIERGHRLLAAGTSLTGAAVAVGMPDLSYFRRSYRRFLDDYAVR